MDILVTDLDRANQRAQIAERELERVQALATQGQHHLKVSLILFFMFINGKSISIDPG